MTARAQLGYGLLLGLALACGDEAPAPRSDLPSYAAEFAALAAQLRASDDEYVGTQQLTEIDRTLQRADLADRQRTDLHYQRAYHLLRLGEVDEAVAEIERTGALWRALPGFERGVPPAFHQLRAVAYLRLAEVRNCITSTDRACCVFPLQGGGVHADREPAQEARTSLLAMLEAQPADLGARWLLNLVAMALGEFPDGVPAQYRIPESAFASEHDPGRFPNVAGELGVDTFNLCGGVVADDFDGDGHTDLITSTYDLDGPLTHYRSRGDGTFADVSVETHTADQRGGLNLIAGDVDNDGDLDLLVLRGAWQFDRGQIRNSLLRNDGGAFADVTREAGLALPARPTQTAAFGDFDNDGDLDLYVGNESRRELPGTDGNGDYPSQLFRNDGDGTFTDVAAEAGVTNDRYAKSVAAGDYDNDGDIDLYVSNVGPNRLYRNDGGLRFTDVAAELGVTEPRGRSFATWFFDHDNDGDLDLFVAAYEASIADLAAEALGLPHRAVPPRLYENDGQGHFRDVAAARGLAHPYLPMGASFGDLDNDGFLDVYLATGDPDYRSLMPNVMLRNDRGQRFQDVTAAGGFGHLQKGHGVAFADLDGDGDQDLYHQLGGFVPGDKFRNALFQNPGHGNAWLVVRLVGVRSNRFGVGARLALTVRDRDGTRREIHRAVGCVSGFGGSPLRQEIGLGEAEVVERLEVWWPASGIRQRFADVAPNQRIEITEGVDALRRLR